MIERTNRVPLVIAALVALFVSPAGAELSVRIESPAQEPTFGEVEFRASVDALSLAAGDSIARMVFFVDQREVGKRSAPPWVVVTDVGQENRERVFEVKVTSAGGDEGSASWTTPAIQVDMEITLELQQLYVTVLAGGQRVRGLAREDFRVLDRGVEEELVTFEGGDAPLAAALLVDTSASMAGAPLEAALAGSRTFIAGMNELDRVTAYVFSDRLRKLTPWSGDPDELVFATEGLGARGNTAIWDELYRAIGDLDAQQGRRVAVLLSDGADLHSALGMEEILWRLRRSATVLYWLRLEGGSEGGFRTAWRNEASNRREFELLRQAVELSGGRVLDIESVEEVEPAFLELLSELRDQYVLGYYPSSRQHDGRWRSVTVRVHGRGSVARSRAGYIDQ